MKLRPLLLGLSLLTSAGMANAALEDFFQVHNVPNTQLVFSTWSIGMGTVSKTAVFCVASSNYRNMFTLPPPTLTPAAVHEKYWLKLSSRNPSSGFYFYLNNDSSQTGNATLLSTIRYLDSKDGSNWENLEEGVLGGEHTGQFRTCKDGKNGTVEITLPAAQLENARAGSYRARLKFTGTGGSSGSAADSDNFRSDIVVADIVRVSGLSDIAFGIHSPGADQVAERSFCVYANNDTAAYAVSISSPNQDASGNFFLDGAADTIPYSVYFKADTSAGFGTAVALAPIAGTGNNTSSSCGTDNAKISVSVSDTDIVPSKSGNYSDTLTILVAPN